MIIKELAPKGDGTMAGVILRILIICLVITPPEGDGSYYLVLSCANDVSKKKFHQRKKNSEKQLKPFQTSTI